LGAPIALWWHLPNNTASSTRKAKLVISIRSLSIGYPWIAVRPFLQFPQIETVAGRLRRRQRLALRRRSLVHSVLLMHFMNFDPTQKPSLWGTTTSAPTGSRSL
jgi:hypothetical protein